MRCCVLDLSREFTKNRLTTLTYASIQNTGLMKIWPLDSNAPHDHNKEDKDCDRVNPDNGGRSGPSEPENAVVMRLSNFS